MTLSVRRVHTTARSSGRPAGLFIVTEDHSEVVVRFLPRTQNAPPLWRCVSCDARSAKTECIHTFSVALFLAETELGLTRIAELEAQSA